MPTTATSGDKACCWICLEEGNDDHGQPLTRSCACRGDSGWAHVACLAGFAKVKTDGMSIDDYTEIIAKGKGTAWSVCHTCKQKYHGDLKKSLANEWIGSLAGRGDVTYQRIAAMLNEISTFMQNKEFDVAILLCKGILSVVHSNRDIDPTLFNDHKMFWAYVTNDCLAVLTGAYVRLGNMEQGREYAEKYKSFNGSMRLSNPDEVDATVKMMMEGPTPGDNIRIITGMYNSIVRSDGKDSRAAIKVAYNVASTMFAAQKFEESYHWLKDAHDRAKRVFGKENPDYISIKREYLLISRTHGPREGTLVLENSKLNGKEVTILRATKDGEKFIVAIGSETGSAKKVKVTPSQLVFAADTPVTIEIDSEDFTVYIDSFDKEANSYKAFALLGPRDGDKKMHAYLDISRKNVAVQFVPLSEISQYIPDP